MMPGRGREDEVSEAEAAEFVTRHAGAAFAERLRGPVGPGGRALSGGQRQLVWCLRLLLRPPPIVLMDEPTASLDAATKDVVVRLLDDLLADGRTAVIVTHDPYLLERCDAHWTMPPAG